MSSVARPVSPEEDNMDFENKSSDESKDPSLHSSSMRDSISFSAAVLNLLNSLIGAGILGIPYAMRYTGLIPSVIILVIVALLSHFSADIAFRCQKIINDRGAHAEGLDSMSLYTMGKPGQYILSVLNIAFMYASLVAYLIISGNILTSWLELLGLTNLEKVGPRALIVLVYFLVIPFPLTIPKRISFLNYTSYLNIVCCIWYLIAMTIKAVTLFPKRGVGTGFILGKFDVGFFNAISVYGLTFSVCICILPLIIPFENNMKSRIMVSAVSTAACFIIVAYPSIIAYCLLGSECKDIVLDSFENSDVIIIISRVCFLLIVSCAYPCVTKPIIASYAQFFYSTNDPTALDGWPRVICNLLSNLPPLILGMFWAKAGTVLGIGGALGGCLCDFCYPPAIYILLKYKEISLRSPIVIAMMLFILFGVVAAIVSVWLSIQEAIESL